jgi:hypothetical protein
MTTEDNFSMETTIYVSTASKLNFEQTQSITNELLHIMGYPDFQKGFKFRFIDGVEMVEAHAFVDNNLKISVIN